MDNVHTLLKTFFDGNNYFQKSCLEMLNTSVDNLHLVAAH